MIDAYTDTWREVAAKANETIEQCRWRLEQNDQSYGESQFLRGRITAMREILEMVKPAVVASTNPPHELRPRDRSGI
jgi:predicted GTPase